MWFCYALGLIPLIIGAFLWLGSRKITFREWLEGVIIGIVIIIGFHYYIAMMYIADVEFRSGRIISATYQPEWKESASKKNIVHKERWILTADFGFSNYNFLIDKTEFENYQKIFGVKELKQEKPDRPDYLSGSQFIYVAENKENILIPVHAIFRFDNVSKLAPEISSYVPPPTEATVFEYPIHKRYLEFDTGPFAPITRFANLVLSDQDEKIPFYENWRSSDRLLGNAGKDFSIEAWDKLNARVGPKKKVNIIAVGLDGDSSMGQWQEAKWQGGKKNDIVICYGPLQANHKPTWTYCFGWSQDELVKRNLESIFLNNQLEDKLLPQIEKEISKNFQHKKWDKINYFAIPVPFKSVSWLMGILIVFQGIYWFKAYRNNDERKAVGESEILVLAQELINAERSAENKHLKKEIKENLSHLDLNNLAELKQEMLNGEKPYLAVKAISMHPDQKQAVPLLVLALSLASDYASEIAQENLGNNFSSPQKSNELQKVVPELIERLLDKNLQVRKKAKNVLNRINPDWVESTAGRKQEDQLKEKLSAGKIDEMLIDALGARGRKIGNFLNKQLQENPAEPTLIALIKIMGRTQNIAMVAKINEYFSSENKKLQQAAINALAELGPDLKKSHLAGKVFQTCRELLENAPDNRDLIAILGFTGKEDALDILLPIAENTHHNAIKEQAFESLTNLPSLKTEKALMELIPSLDEGEKKLAVNALACFDGQQIKEYLIDLLKKNIHEDRVITIDVSETIIDQLAKYEDPKIDDIFSQIVINKVSFLNTRAAQHIVKKKGSANSGL